MRNEDNNRHRFSLFSNTSHIYREKLCTEIKKKVDQYNKRIKDFDPEKLLSEKEILEANLPALQKNHDLTLDSYRIKYSNYDQPRESFFGLSIEDIESAQFQYTIAKMQLDAAINSLKLINEQLEMEINSDSSMDIQFSL